MPNATRLDSDVAHWIPVARHYQVDGGYLVVVAANFFTAKGTDVFYADETAGPISMEPIVQFPDGTSHDEALTNLGYTVVDTVGVEQPAVNPAPDPVAVQESVLSMLPEPIAAMVAAAVNELPET